MMIFPACPLAPYRVPTSFFVSPRYWKLLWHPSELFQSSQGLCNLLRIIAVLGWSPEAFFFAFRVPQSKSKFTALTCKNCKRRAWANMKRPQEKMNSKKNIYSLIPKAQSIYKLLIWSPIAHIDGALRSLHTSEIQFEFLQAVRDDRPREVNH